MAFATHSCKIKSDPPNDSYLASERQEILVKELGCKAMTSVAFRSLDVLVHLPLRLEPLLQNISQLHLHQLNNYFLATCKMN